MLKLDYLKAVLHYDPDTGLFTYLVKRGQCIPGRIAGKKSKHGYWRVSVDRVLYSAHRLAWFYVNEEWPTGDIDHVNRDKLDNRIRNLRLATPSQNGANTAVKSRNTSGFKGVTWHKSCKKWQAAIKVAGKNIHLGLWDDPKEAHAAYVAAANEHFGEYARPA